MNGEATAWVSPEPTRAPRHPLPPGACDCHAHVFGPLDRWPTQVATRYTPPLGTIEAYIAMLDGLGADHGVLVHPTSYGFDHALIAEALRRGRGRLRGIGVLPPDAAPATFRDLDAAGIRGLRFTENARGLAPLKQVSPGRVGLSVLEALAPRLRDHGWHAVIWAALERFVAAAERLRPLGVPLVLDHMGYFDAAKGVNDADFQHLLRLVGDGDVWVKLTLCRIGADHGRYADAKPFHDALVAANPERLLWGSDWPFISLDQTKMNAGRLLDIFDTLVADDGVRQRILVDNPATLYGFGGA